MSTFTILFHKEFREAWRSFKFLWMPLLFIFLGINDPLVNYYMEDILTAVGNMPEGFTMTMPTLVPSDLLLASTGQFQSIGLIVFVATVAGMISRERQNGTVTLLYVRPIAASAVFMSKLAVAVLLGTVSTVAGYIGSIYYTALLYGPVDVVGFLQMIASYCLWLVFVSAVCLMLSAMCKTSIAMTIAMIVLPVGVIIDALIGGFWHVTPLKLASYGAQLLESTSSYYVETVLLTVGFSIVVTVIGIIFTKRKMPTSTI